MELRPRLPKLPFVSSWNDETEVTALERWIVRRAFRVDDVPISVTLWNGEVLRGNGRAKLIARVEIRERQFVRDFVMNPDLTLGDAYTDGTLEVDGDLSEALIALFRQRLSSTSTWTKPFQRLVSARPRINTQSRSRDNVHHHYDVGNDFYKLWLDERLQYTCAYFPTKGADLETAQLAKMDHVCRKVRLSESDRVVEAGCGWGGLALHMAEKYGAKVRAFNLSTEQIAYARENAKRKGLDKRVEFIEDDYREVSGKYDVFMSVGMLEHVGKAHYPTLGRVIERSLKSDGRGLVHSIGRSQPMLMNPWLDRRIFPGAYMPSLREMLEVFESVNLAVLDVENIRLHYAKTLRHWLARLEEHAEEIEEMYDERFLRTYRLYLASSVASFTAGSTHLYQAVFSRPENNSIPWTRAHVYADED